MGIASLQSSTTDDVPCLFPGIKKLLQAAAVLNEPLQPCSSEQRSPPPPPPPRGWGAGGACHADRCNNNSFTCEMHNNMV